MAQLFPGATAVTSVSCAFVTFVNGPQSGLLRLFSMIGDMWFASLKGTVVFLFLSAAAGIFLHGIDWMTLGGLYDKYPEAGVRDFRFHKRPIAFQLLMAPLNMIYELGILISRKHLDSVTVGENAPYVDSGLLPTLKYLQDFYLHFAQFFIHMSYALLVSLIMFTLIIRRMGFTTQRAALLVLIYFVLSAFFLMGRAQLHILFSSERVLVSKSAVPVAIPPEDHGPVASQETVKGEE